MPASARTARRDFFRKARRESGESGVQPRATARSSLARVEPLARLDRRENRRRITMSPPFRPPLSESRAVTAAAPAAWSAPSAE